MERMAAMLWLTSKIVRPSPRMERSLSRHLRWNSASPTARTSSTTRISGSRCTAAKRQPHEHAAGITLHRGFEKRLNARERDDLVELPHHLGALHAEDGAAEQNVFASGEFGVKTGADFEQRSDPAVHFAHALRRFGDARDHFEERALPCPVAA